MSELDEHAHQLAVLSDIACVATLDLELRDALQRVTELLYARFAWEFVACFCLDPGRQHVVCEAVHTSIATDIAVGMRRPLDIDMWTRAVATGSPVLLDNTTPETRSIGLIPRVPAELCVPIKHAGRVIALLHLGSKRWAAFRDQLRLLDAVASQVAGAVASATRFEELRQHAVFMEMMSQVSRLALEATELDELLQRIVHYIADHFTVAIASILLLDETGQKFILETYGGPLDLRMPDGEDWPIAVGVCGRCARTGKPQLIVDVASDPDYVCGNEAIRSEYIVPIRYRDRLLGVLNLESTETDTFTADVQRMFCSLADQVAGAVNLSSVNAKLHHAIAKLERLSSIDGLTQVANRRRFDQVLDIEWRRAYRQNRPLSAMLADVDFFKALNDTYGHQYGDDCLRKIAREMAAGLRRASDLIARYGGEEFAVILPETEAHHALAHADRLRNRIETLGIPHRASSVSDHVTISIGVATIHPREVGPSDVLIQAADIALYQAKRDGRNRVIGRIL